MAFDLIIIGAGVVGLATGMEVVQRFPGISLAVLEKETTVAAHQTGHNSGVIHSGLYYRPGSLKAQLCVAGAAAMVAFCRKHGIPYEICGKIVTALNQEEAARLKDLYQRGVANAVPGLRLISREELLEIEPHSGGISGLHAPSTGITDYVQVSKKYAELIEAGGGQVRLNTKVTGVQRQGGEMILETTGGEYRARGIVNCGGLHSDRICEMAGAQPGLRLIPFRGEYYDINPARASMVRGLIYPVPNPQLPFLGVHFTRRVTGGIEAGPNAVLAFKREGYKRFDFSFADVAGMVSFPASGAWLRASGGPALMSIGARSVRRCLPNPCNVCCPNSPNPIWLPAAQGSALRL